MAEINKFVDDWMISGDINEMEVRAFGKTGVANSHKKKVCLGSKVMQSPTGRMYNSKVQD